MKALPCANKARGRRSHPQYNNLSTPVNYFSMVKTHFSFVLLSVAGGHLAAGEARDSVFAHPEARESVFANPKARESVFAIIGSAG